MPLSPPAAPLPWPVRLSPTPAARWLRFPGLAQLPLPPTGTKEYCLWQMRRDFVDGLQGDVVALAAVSPEGDRLARQAQVAMDIWQQNPESFAGELPEAEEYLTRLPMLRVAICITCLKREDQLKQTLPVLCLFIAQIRSARSSAHPKRSHRQPASQQAIQQTRRRHNQFCSRQPSRQPEYQSDSSAASHSTAGNRVGLPADLSASQPASKRASKPAVQPPKTFAD